MRLRGLYIHFEIEKISIFLCQKVMRICAEKNHSEPVGESPA